MICPHLTVSPSLRKKGVSFPDGCNNASYSHTSAFFCPVTLPFLPARGRMYLNPGLAIRLALTNGTSQCAQRFQKSLHTGLLSLAVVATPDHCVNKLKPACWNGNREGNKGAPDRHVSDTTLGQATPFEPLHDLLCMVNSGKTRKLPSRAQCKLLNHTQKTVIVSIPLNSGLLCYTVINTYMLEGGSESCSQSHKKSSVGVGFQARAASSTA